MNTLRHHSLIARPNRVRNPKVRAKHPVGLALALLGLTNWIILSGSAFAYKANTATQPGQSGSGVDSTSSASGQVAPLGLNVWSTHGPGAYISSLAIDPVNPTTLYAATVDFTVFRSTNGGGSWNAVNIGAAAAFGIELAIDPSDQNIIYLGCGFGLFKSTDFGATWSHEGATEGYQVGPLAIDPGNPDTIYAGFFVCSDYDCTSFVSNVSKSTDAGESWRPVLDLGTVVGPLAIDQRNPSTVYEGTVDGIFKSTDGGATWNFFNAGLPASFVSDLAIDPGNSNTIYAGGSGGVFKSTDGGATWNSVGPANAVVDTLAVDPIHPNIIYAGTLDSGVFRSTDAGENWTAFNDGLTNLTVSDLAIDPSGTRLHAGTAAGVFDYQYSTTRGSETGGLYNPAGGAFFLRNSNSTGIADMVFSYGPAAQGWIPLVGDWDGNGTDTIGLYNPSNGVFYLRNTNSTGYADIVFQFGPGGPGWIPIVGDWNGDGVDTVGLYYEPTGVFFLRNSNSTGYADLVFQFGPGGQGWVPIVGDWNGDRTDTVGLYYQPAGLFFLRNSNSSGYADLVFQFGPGGQGWTPLVGDWNADGVDTIGLYNSTNGVFYLRNTNSTGYADIAFLYGPAGQGWIPLVGDWDGL